MAQLTNWILLTALALTPVERAVNYLSKEVARWRPENGCYSCHNNGDGARALYRAGANVDPDTTAWLEQPSRWDSNPGDPIVSDKKLARIQFGAALLARGNAKATCEAARIIAADRTPDGSWKIDAGSPATYGTTLATYFAREVMRICGLDTAPTDAWFARAPVSSVLDAAALYLANRERSDAREYLLKAQTSDGGWGEHAGMPAQVFDTAIAIIALRGATKEVTRGKAWLLAKQQVQGGWPETTRPPGAQSYAQHISTTAWALLALLD